MKQGTTELISLLRAFVDEVPLSKEEMQQLNAVFPDALHLAKLHNVMGILAYKIREYYALNGVADAEDQEVADIAHQIYSRTVTLAVKREEHYQRLSNKLSEAEIDHLAFKGIMVKNLYPVPELRTFGDIDFVIRPKDRERCHTLMQDLGYDITVDFEPVYTYQKDMELYEVHTCIMSVNITNRANYVEYFQNLWEFASPTENHVWEFSPEFHFIYLLSHIAKHIYGSGAGIRMYLDLALYIKRLESTMNWNTVQKELQKLELVQFFHLVLQCLNRWFCITPPVSVPEIDEVLLKDFEAFTLSGGVFGFEGRKSGEQLVRKQGMKGEKGLRKNALKKIFFPSAATIKSRYTYLEKHPYLLPIAWLDRLIRNFKKIGFKLEESRDIITMSDETIQENKTFYQKIGL